jgi:hypothetical protein
MKNNRSILSFLPVLAVLSVVSSCSARYEVLVERGGSARVELSASVGARTSTLIANLEGRGSGASSPLLDAASVSRSLASAPGGAAANLTNSSQRSISGSVTISKLDRFLSSRFVRLETSESGGKVTVSFDRASAPEILGALSPEIGDYLSALAAPVATGEKLGGAEYLELVSSMYGSGVADEIRESRIRFALKLPGPAAAVRGGTASGNTAEFSLALLDVLTLERPIHLEASWR